MVDIPALPNRSQGRSQLAALQAQQTSAAPGKPGVLSGSYKPAPAAADATRPALMPLNQMLPLAMFDSRKQQRSSDAGGGGKDQFKPKTGGHGPGCGQGDAPTHAAVGWDIDADDDDVDVQPLSTGSKWPATTTPGPHQTTITDHFGRQTPNWSRRRSTLSDSLGAPGTIMHFPAVPKPVGMVNNGNTCYLNSVLQVLLSLHPFIAALLSPQLTALQLRENGIIAALRQLLQEQQVAQSSAVRYAISPAVLKETLGRVSKRWRDHRQQDAHEFMVDLLALVQAEVLAAEASQHPGRKRFALSSTQCPATRTFSGCLLRTYRCSACQHVSRVKEQSSHLSLQLPVSDLGAVTAPPTLQSLLATHFKEDELEKTCEACKAVNAPHRVSLQVRRLPRVLVVHLKRFDMVRDDGGGCKYTKLHAALDVSEVAKLEAFCEPTSMAHPLQLDPLPPLADLLPPLPAMATLAHAATGERAFGSSSGAFLSNGGFVVDNVHGMDMIVSPDGQCQFGPSELLPPERTPSPPAICHVVAPHELPQDSGSPLQFTPEDGGVQDETGAAARLEPSMLSIGEKRPTWGAIRRTGPLHWGKSSNAVDTSGGCGLVGQAGPVLVVPITAATGPRKPSHRPVQRLGSMSASDLTSGMSFHSQQQKQGTHQLHAVYPTAYAPALTSTTPVPANVGPVPARSFFGSASKSPAAVGGSEAAALEASCASALLASATAGKEVTGKADSDEWGSSRDSHDSFASGQSNHSKRSAADAAMTDQRKHATAAVSGATAMQAPSLQPHAVINAATDPPRCVRRQSPQLITFQPPHQTSVGAPAMHNASDSSKPQYRAYMHEAGAALIAAQAHAVQSAKSAAGAAAARCQNWNQFAPPAPPASPNATEDGGGGSVADGCDEEPDTSKRARLTDSPNTSMYTAQGDQPPAEEEFMDEDLRLAIAESMKTHQQEEGRRSGQPEQQQQDESQGGPEQHAGQWGWHDQQSEPQQEAGEEAAGDRTLHPVRAFDADTGQDGQDQQPQAKPQQKYRSLTKDMARQRCAGPGNSWPRADLGLHNKLTAGQTGSALGRASSVGQDLTSAMANATTARTHGELDGLDTLLGASSAEKLSKGCGLESRHSVPGGGIGSAMEQASTAAMGMSGKSSTSWQETCRPLLGPRPLPSAQQGMHSWPASADVKAKRKAAQRDRAGGAVPDGAASADEDDDVRDKRLAAKLAQEEDLLAMDEDDRRHAGFEGEYGSNRHHDQNMWDAVLNCPNTHRGALSANITLHQRQQQSAGQPKALAQSFARTTNSKQQQHQQDDSLRGNEWYAAAAQSSRRSTQPSFTITTGVSNANFGVLANQNGGSASLDPADDPDDLPELHDDDPAYGREPMAIVDGDDDKEDHKFLIQEMLDCSGNGGSSTVDDAMDLTGDATEEEQLQRALELSLVETQYVPEQVEGFEAAPARSAEEDDLAKALALSMEDMPDNNLTDASYQPLEATAGDNDVTMMDADSGGRNSPDFGGVAGGSGHRHGDVEIASQRLALPKVYLTEDSDAEEEEECGAEAPVGTAAGTAGVGGGEAGAPGPADRMHAEGEQTGGNGKVDVGGAASGAPIAHGQVQPAVTCNSDNTSVGSILAGPASASSADHADVPHAPAPPTASTPAAAGVQHLLQSSTPYSAAAGDASNGVAADLSRVSRSEDGEVVAADDAAVNNVTVSRYAPAETRGLMIPLSLVADYRLHAVVNHKGNTPHLGHYVADIRKGDAWFHHDDTVVNHTTTSAVLKSAAHEGYLLFFVNSAM